MKLQVSKHVIFMLDFSHNNKARILLLACGLHFFSLSAPADLFVYGSHIGEMPAYSTIHHALKGLSAHESELTLAHGRNPMKWGMIQFDNVQHYLHQ
jgi:hypothetical protein